MRVFGCDMTVVWKVFSYRPTTQKPIQNFYRKEFCVSNPIRHQPQHRTQQYANQTRITLPRITFYAHQIRRFVYTKHPFVCSVINSFFIVSYYKIFLQHTPKTKTIITHQWSILLVRTLFEIYLHLVSLKTTTIYFSGSNNKFVQNFN